MVGYSRLAKASLFPATNIIPPHPPSYVWPLGVFFGFVASASLIQIHLSFSLCSVIVGLFWIAFCGIPSLRFCMRPRPSRHMDSVSSGSEGAQSPPPFFLAPRTVQACLCILGRCCCTCLVWFPGAESAPKYPTCGQFVAHPFILFFPFAFPSPVRFVDKKRC